MRYISEVARGLMRDLFDPNARPVFDGLAPSKIPRKALKPSYRSEDEAWAAFKEYLGRKGLRLYETETENEIPDGHAAERRGNDISIAKNYPTHKRIEMGLHEVGAGYDHENDDLTAQENAVRLAKDEFPYIPALREAEIALKKLRRNYMF